MKNLFSVLAGLMWAILNKIAAKIPADLADDLNNDPKMIDAMVAGAVEYKAKKLALAEKNPYEMSVDEQIAALRRANDEEGWGLAEEVFMQLIASAPEWPQGRHSYRSLRVRFGEESEGVALTFERHVGRIKRVFTEKGFWRWEHLHSAPVDYYGKPVERLRLLVGNDTHHAVVEWTVVDLDTHRQRKSVEAVRGPDSLADELLVIAWMFPQMIKDIDYDKLPGLIAAGYELNTPMYCGSWQRVVLVRFNNRGACQVLVDAYSHGYHESLDSVPVRREDRR